MTGDFMTGTAPASNVQRALDEGKKAFAGQDFAKAIEAFKSVLATDPNQPEAHAYMGFILVQAGHGDGALLAFDKALERVPNFPMALWGKGLVLFREKQDYAAARATLEKLLNMMPAGEQRDEVQKILGEIPTGNGPAAGRPAVASTAAGPSITGTITVDSKFKDQLSADAVLFIIARSAAGGAGPPLAVKKIDKPKFPLTYSLGPENVMMQGMPFSGTVNISVRLDKDGNPTTRGAGDITGDYKNNPAEVGAKSIDIVLDRINP